MPTRNKNTHAETFFIICQSSLHIKVGTGQGRESGVTTIQIDNQQPTLSPKKDAQGWWNAFTAEDVDRLLELGNWGRWNTYTAEDVDRMFQLGPVRRRSLRRGSYERR